jgi:hypothetical protein
MQKLSLVACKHRLTKSPNHRITNYSGCAFMILLPLGITQTGPFDKLRDRLVSAFAPHKLSPISRLVDSPIRQFFKKISFIRYAHEIFRDSA